jgi:hypothetical protein
MGTTDKLLVHEPMHAVYKNADTFQRFLPAIRLTGSLLLSVQIPVPNFDTNLTIILICSELPSESRAEAKRRSRVVNTSASYSRDLGFKVRPKSPRANASIVPLN